MKTENKENKFDAEKLLAILQAPEELREAFDITAIGLSKEGISKLLQVHNPTESGAELLKSVRLKAGDLVGWKYSDDQFIVLKVYICHDCDNPAIFKSFAEPYVWLMNVRTAKVSNWKVNQFFVVRECQSYSLKPQLVQV